MPSLRTLVVSSLALVMACRGEMASTDTATSTTATPQATPAASTATAPPAPPLPACYPEISTGGPSALPAVAITGNVPLFVPLPDTINSPTQIRPYFDWFSWEEFIALNWPASTTGRGNAQSPDDPNVFKNATPGTATVWSTYKATWELFSQGDARPTEFDSYDNPVPPQCGSSKVTGEGEKRTLVLASKFTVLNDGAQAFSFPLVDTAREYVMYEIRYGRQPYTFIRGADNDPKSWLYLAKNVPDKQLFLPETTSTNAGSKANQLGSIMIKAAWRDMAPLPKEQWSRYYVVDAEVFDPATQKCADTSVGLVGLHIVQKLDLFPEWVWSTFEHVDVVTANQQASLLQDCPATDPECKALGYKNRPATTSLLPNKAERVPVQALRLNEIPTTPPGASTVDANAAFQKALAGTPWANYQLVVTQWPFAANQEGTFKAPGNGGSYPCTCGWPFPVNGTVNLTMETYFQSANSAAGLGNGCMSCHFGAALTDFSWGLNRRPH